MPAEMGDMGREKWNHMASESSTGVHGVDRWTRVSQMTRA